MVRSLFPKTPAPKPQEVVPERASSPKSLFGKVVVAASKPTPATPSVAGKSLFPQSAVSSTAQIDADLIANPACAGLSIKDISRVRNIINAAQVDKADYVLHYGESLRDEFSSLVNNIIKESNLNNGTEMHGLMSDILGKIQSLNLATLFSPKPRTFWENLVYKPNDDNMVESIVSSVPLQFQTIDAAITGLLTYVDGIVNNVAQLDDLFKANRDNFTLLTLHVAAGKVIVERQTQQVIPGKEAAINSADAFATFDRQNLTYYKDSVARFARKVQDLEMVAISMLQLAPQIRMMQNNAKDTAEKIRRLASLTVPAWKTQCLVLIELLSKAAKGTAGQQIDKVVKDNLPLVTKIDQAYKTVVAGFTN